MPPLLIKTSILLSKNLAALATVALISVTERRLQRPEEMFGWNCFRWVLTQWFSSCSSKSMMKTLWPFWRKVRARQRPIPRAAPRFWRLVLCFE